MEGPRVKIAKGEIEGIENVTVKGKEFWSFNGIPYAEPPIGNLRFKPPVPISPWTGIKQTKVEGNISVQPDENTKEIIGDEDCLYLNVHTPKTYKESSKLLPVVVYLHHGSFTVGSGTSSLFGPNHFIEKDIIFVSINYRLGALGFLCLHNEDAFGNMGLKDQNLALKWIQENIKYFKGNPDSVTLMGVSAGSASVEYHTLSLASKGLFHRTVLTSGSVLNPWTRSYKPVEIAFHVAELLGCKTTSKKELFQFLKSTHAAKLVQASNRKLTKDEIKACELYEFNPVIEVMDGNTEPFLTDEPYDLLKKGSFFKVPSIVGFCEKEGTLFKDDYGEFGRAIFNGEFLDCVPEYLDKKGAILNEELKKIYYKGRETDLNDDDVLNDFLSDVMFIGGIYTSLKLKSKFNKSIYLYKFNRDSKANFVKTLFDIKEKGACHGDEVSYLGPNVVVDPSRFSDDDLEISRGMIDFWSAFIKTGNLNSENSVVEWLEIAEDINYLEISNDFAMKNNPWPERLNFWWNLYNECL